MGSHRLGHLHPASSTTTAPTGWWNRSWPRAGNHSMTAAARAWASHWLACTSLPERRTGRGVFGRAVDPITVWLPADEEMVAAALQERLEDMDYGSEVDPSRPRYHQLSGIRPINTPDGAPDRLDLVGAPMAGPAGDRHLRPGDSRRGEGLRPPHLDLYRLASPHHSRPTGRRYCASTTLSTSTSGCGLSAKTGDVDIALVHRGIGRGTHPRTATHRPLGWVPEKVIAGVAKQ